MSAFAQTTSCRSTSRCVTAGVIFKPVTRNNPLIYQYDIPASFTCVYCRIDYLCFNVEQVLHAFATCSIQSVVYKLLLCTLTVLLLIHENMNTDQLHTANKFQQASEGICLANNIVTSVLSYNILLGSRVDMYPLFTQLTSHYCSL